MSNGKTQLSNNWGYEYTTYDAREQMILLGAYGQHCRNYEQMYVSVCDDNKITYKKT